MCKKAKVPPVCHISVPFSSYLDIRPYLCHCHSQKSCHCPICFSTIFVVAFSALLMNFSSGIFAKIKWGNSLEKFEMLVRKWLNERLLLSALGLRTLNDHSFIYSVVHFQMNKSNVIA
jgi:hypothetical protein